MRISCHPLAIETGRDEKITRDDRFALYVKHLLVMSFNATTHLREVFLERRLFAINNNFRKFTYKALFKCILAFCDDNITLVHRSCVNPIWPGLFFRS